MTQKKQASIRTPLGKARGLGSARDGTMHWWALRVTSVMMIPLFFYIAGHARYFLPIPQDWLNLIILLNDPYLMLALILTVVISYYHAALGVQTIIEDYVHSEKSKIICLLLNKAFFFVAGAVCVYALLYINFALYGAEK